MFGLGQAPPSSRSQISPLAFIILFLFQHLTNHHHEPHQKLHTLLTPLLPYNNTPTTIHQASRLPLLLVNLSLLKLPFHQIDTLQCFLFILPTLHNRSTIHLEVSFCCAYVTLFAHFSGFIILTRLHISKPPTTKIIPLMQAETLPRNARGTRRRPRRSANSTPSQISSAQNNADISVDPNLSRESDQPMRILRRDEYDQLPAVSITGNLELPNPITPPRPRSMYDQFPDAQYQGNQSALDMNQRRKKGRKSHGGITRASGAPKSNPNEDPLLASPQKPLTPFTPSRPNETPVKAYAGPTFHASPAPSSLPMPKFMSRSVPNVDKTSSLKSMMEQEAVDTTSESDSSLFQENSRPTQDRQAREDSPLDIFFRADRDAKNKAKAQIGSPTIPNSLRSESQNDVRQHARQPTDSSLGGIFALEMDGTAAELPDRKESKESNTRVPKAMTETDYRDEHRKAQTEELKKLLYSPKPSRSASSSPCSGTPTKTSGSGSVASKNHPHRGSPGLTPDATTKEQQRHALLLALAQKQISGIGTNIGSAPQRPPSSNLRKEMSIPSSPGVQPLELPATPTQSRLQKTPISSTGHAQNGYVSPYSSIPLAFTPQSQSPGRCQITSSQKSVDAKSIEEDLRRILKLDVLGGDDVTSVRS